ncbi:hypothetical protein GALMADRAFT_585719 [Galerina marginata CBS 339.88]|uniref:F-box domain-containing protein n=1 Tax=Galerina marginata (strain CBS 339.88) TaxID=685588 RepID=A0A067T3H5_GALM3|nr:hypothetical protein GALMADRAFT_585719 [Galerina marginata CBS 339.88]
MKSLTQADSTLPQEIVNLIIDEVANNLKPEREALAALRACSLVSKSFHYPSRRYLFSEIKFIADGFAQKRAARLVQTLNRRSNGDLVLNVRSVTFVLDIPPTLIQLRYRYQKKGLRGLFSRWQWQQKFLGVKKRFGLLESRVLKLLEVLDHSELEHFGLVAQAQVLDWGIGNLVTVPAFLQIFSNPNLNSLHFMNITNIPESIITDAFFSTNLKELVLCNLTTKRSSSIFSGATTPALANLLRLEMKRVSYTALFSILIPFLPPSSPSPYSQIRFAHLKTLSVSIPNGSTETDALWEFILGVSPTLETLALEHHGWPDSGLDPVGSFNLSRLVSLRNFKFSSSSFNTSADLESRQSMLTNLLGSATSPTAIETIDILFSLQSVERFKKRHSISIWRTALGWSTMDEKMSSGIFPELQKVNLSVDVFYHDPTFDVTEYRPEYSREYARTILPAVATISTIDFHLDVHSSGYGAHQMGYQLTGANYCLTS